MSGSGGLHEFRDLIDSETRPASVIILEDGLFSGFEFVRILQSLVGDAGCAKPKCPRLKNPEILNSINICLHFALATDLGIHHLRDALERLSLTNVRISYPESGYYQVLSAAGRDALGRGVLFETDPDGIHVVASPEHHLDFSAFRNGYVWGDQDKRRRAIEFCRRVGTQLWRDRVGGKDPPWSERRINDCSLGASNMAFAFAFSHSIPKASLPLFWYSGPVSTESGKTIIWEALFPNSS